MNGKFVTIEGCDGVGKSTQVRLLRERFEREGIEAVFTREPGGTGISEKIRGIILDAKNAEMDSLTELFLYEASRRQHTKEIIEPALKEGKLVICDRYIDSTLAYQGYGRGLDVAMIEKLNEWAMGGVKIDLTLFLNVSAKDGFSRKGGASGDDRLEGEKADFYERIYDGFVAIAERESRFKKIDASGDKYSTHEKLYAYLKDNGYIAR